MKLFIHAIALMAALAFAISPATAGTVQTDYTMDKTETYSAFPFEKGAHEIQLGAGPFFSLSSGSGIRPTMDLAIGSLRYGWMLSTPGSPGFFRGNNEFLIDVYGGGVFDGPGGMLAGVTLIYRYNFVQPDASIVPYFQVGAGGLYNTIHENHPQRLIGSAFEFNLEAALGLRFMLSDAWAIFIEGGVRHISNANIGDRNNGLNTIGGLVGVSYFY